MLKIFRKTKQKTLRALLLLDATHCSCPAALETGCKPKLVITSVNTKPVFNTPNVSTF